MLKRVALILKNNNSISNKYNFSKVNNLFGKKILNIGVLGGGISSLSLGHYLLKYKDLDTQLNITIIDKNNLGGCIKTYQIPDDKKVRFGGVIEEGPKSIRSGTGINTLRLIHEIGLQDSLISGDLNAAKNRYIYSCGDITKLPSKFKEIFSLTGLKIILCILRGPKYKLKEGEDETIGQFFDRNFTKGLGETIGSAMSLGIFAGDVDKLSFKSCFPAQYDALVKYGSIRNLIVQSIKKRILKIKKGDEDDDNDVKKKENESEEFNKFLRSDKYNDIRRSGVFSVHGGLSNIINQLKSHLLKHHNSNNNSDSVHILSGSKIVAMKFNEENKVIIKIEHYQEEKEGEDNIQELKFDHVFSTLPSYEVANLIYPYSNSLADKLNSIKYASVATINLVWNNNVLQKKDSVVSNQQIFSVPSNLNGFGYLIPSKEHSPIIGVTFDSLTFPDLNSKFKYSDNNQTRLTTMIGGDIDKSVNPNAVAFDDYNLTPEKQKYLYNLVQKTLSKHLNKNIPLPSPDHHTIHLWHKSIPQKYVNHSELINNIQTQAGNIFKNHTQSSNITLLGTWINPVGINDCISHSKQSVVDYFNKNN